MWRQCSTGVGQAEGQYWAGVCIHVFVPEVGWFLGTVTYSTENSWA